MGLPRPKRIFPLGDHAVTVEFANELSREANDASVALSDHFQANPFPGFIEAAPAIASVTLFYRPGIPLDASGGRKTGFASVKELVEGSLSSIDVTSAESRPTITIPVSFAPEHTLDLGAVAAWAKTSPEEVIDIFLSRSYRVYMLGFLPGFAYMGEVDPRIAAPRHATPRSSVPKGSVGIAGAQPGIYPASSPGGWQIMGKTSVELITEDPTRPCIFAPGDEVRFVRYSG